MTEIIMKQKGITLVCLDCGCRRIILPGEVPVGECPLCYTEFGWTIFPNKFLLTHKEGETILEDGDMVFLDMKESTNSSDRIFEIRRNGLVWYSKLETEKK